MIGRIDWRLAVALAWLCAAAAWAQEPARTAHLWWNDAELVEALALTQPQRAQMDALLAKQPKLKPVAEHIAAFHRALRRGDAEQARRELDAWSEGARDAVRTRGALKIAVVSLLEPGQLEKLSALTPKVIERSWQPRLWWTRQPVPEVQRIPPGP